jgi:hypothetical protein
MFDFISPSSPYGYEPPWWVTLLKFLLGVLVGLILIPPVWKLCGRAGFPRWFSLAMPIPLANVALLYFLAFSVWPADLRREAPTVEDTPHKPASA